MASLNILQDKKKPAKGGFNTVASRPSKRLRAYSILGHEDSDEGQQENQDRIGDRNHDGNVFDDTFNRIIGCV